MSSSGLLNRFFSGHGTDIEREAIGQNTSVTRKLF
ncbi:hypothetical protein EZS27_012530 [termite gut metagenome]|uniref:Uncharacterized protein n=1 Tax=termite gut metagenome TaxID=433724 RepID=A0A5J4S2U5_9ZZZZ